MYKKLTVYHSKEYLMLINNTITTIRLKLIFFQIFQLEVKKLRYSLRHVKSKIIEICLS